MRKKNRLLMAMATILVLLITSCSSSNQEVNVSNILLESQRVSKMYTTEVDISGNVSLDNQKVARILGISVKIGDRKVDVPITMKAKAYIDLAKLNKSDIKIKGKDVCVTLPAPVLEFTAYGSGTPQEDVSWYRSSFSDKEIDKLKKYAFDEYEHKTLARQEAIMESAKNQAIYWFEDLLTKMGYENIEIEFKRNSLIN